MKQFPRALALLSCGLILSACNIDSGTKPSTYTLSGQVLAPGVSAALSLPQQAANNWNAPHVARQVLLLSPALSSQSLSSAALSALSGVRTESLPSAGLTVAYTPDGQSDSEFAAKLTASGLAAQPNYRYQTLSVPNDPGYPANAGINVNGQLYGQDYLTRINAEGGWDKLETLGKTPVGALTAVLDTGVDTNHEDLAGRLLPGRDFCSSLVGDNCSGEDNDPSDLTEGGEAGHGTSSAGLIGAATNNGKGIAGLTWSGRTILPVKVFGANGTTSGATSASLTAGVRYAVAQGAKVINMSLGFVGGNADPALAKAISDAAAADVVLIAAAGNTPNDGLYYPASDANVLAIGALGKDDSLACFSARPKAGQKALDLVAPGGNAGSGTGTCYQTSQYDILTLSNAASKYTLRAGTSEAAPQVSGAAALIRALRPDLSAAQVKSILVSSAQQVSGGKLLNVGQAINAASTFTSGTAPINYTLKVSAFSGGSLVQAFNISSVATVKPQRLPYSFKDLPAGTYTLNATLTIGNTISSGETTVTLNGDKVQNITTR